MSLLNPSNDVVKSPAKLIRVANQRINHAAYVERINPSNNPHSIAASINRKTYSNTLKLAAASLREAADMLDEIRKEGL